MRDLLIAVLCALALGLLSACSFGDGPVTTVESLAEAQAEGEEDKLALDKAISSWIGEAPTTEDRAVRAGLLLAGLAFGWDARLKYGGPVVEDYHLAHTAFLQFDAIAEHLENDRDDLWINSRMFEVQVQVGTLVARSVTARGRRAVTNALINPLSLIQPVKEGVIQAGALKAAGLDVKDIWNRYLSGELERGRVWMSIRTRIRERSERLSAYLGLSTPTSS